MVRSLRETAMQLRKGAIIEKSKMNIITESINTKVWSIPMRIGLKNWKRVWRIG